MNDLILVISIKQNNLTAVELEQDDFEKSVTCEKQIMAAYDIISRSFSQKGLIRAYYATDTCLMGERSENNPGRKMCPKYVLNEIPE